MPILAAAMLESVANDHQPVFESTLKSALRLRRSPNKKKDEPGKLKERSGQASQPAARTKIAIDDTVNVEPTGVVNQWSLIGVADDNANCYENGVKQQ